jgi:hypothetical protein
MEECYNIGDDFGPLSCGEVVSTFWICGVSPRPTANQPKVFVGINCPVIERCFPDHPVASETRQAEKFYCP